MADPRFSYLVDISLAAVSFLLYICLADKSTDDNEAIQFVSEEMQGGRDLCTAAVAQDWEALEFVS